jgi:hypothetical protein
VPHAGRLQPSLSSSHAQIQSSLVQTNFLISSHTPRSTHRLLFLFVTIHTLHRRDNATSLVHLPIKSNTPPTCSLVHNFSHQSVHLHFYPAIPSPQTAQTLFLSTFTCAYTYGANMSVSVEQPLHFSQQLSSPPHSPNHVLHAHTPASPQPPPPPPAAELDMNTSTSADTMPSTGQNHDRGDAEMQDGDEPARRDASTNTIAVEISAIDEDAMDVTPDVEAESLLPNGSSEAQEATITTPASPAPVPDDTVSQTLPS